MIFEYNIKTKEEEFKEITAMVQEAVAKSGVEEGICLVYSPHTTAAITINENADPDVVTDMLLGLDKAFPDRKEFKHMEGNSSAHLKSSNLGASEYIIIKNSQLLLGTWQGIYFCEFDGPRNRTFYVNVQ